MGDIWEADTMEFWCARGPEEARRFKGGRCMLWMLLLELVKSAAKSWERILLLKDGRCMLWKFVLELVKMVPVSWEWILHHLNSRGFTDARCLLCGAVPVS